MKLGGDRTQPEARMSARQHEAQVVQLRLRGARWPEISEAVNMTVRGAQLAWHRALKLVVLPHATEAKIELVEKARVLEMHLWTALGKTEEPTAQAALGNSILRCQARLAALLGADTPTAIAIEAAREPNQNDQLTVDELKRLPAEDLRMLASIMAKAKSGAPAALAPPAQPPPAMLTSQPEVRQAERLPASPEFDFSDEVVVQPTAPPEVYDPPPTPRPPAPTAQQEYKRQRTTWDDQIDAIYTEMGMRCDGENDPNTAVYRARIEKLERLRDFEGDRFASRQN